MKRNTVTGLFSSDNSKAVTSKLSEEWAEVLGANLEIEDLRRQTNPFNSLPVLGRHAQTPEVGIAGHLCVSQDEARDSEDLAGSTEA